MRIKAIFSIEMDANKETLTTWNKIAKAYETVFMDLDIYDTSYALFCSYLEGTPLSVLEIGCGPGNISRYIINKKPDCYFYGIDSSINMVELAKKNNPNGHFEVMDCRSISQFNQSFHGIIAGFVIPYLSIKDCTHFIKNSANLLTTNGIFYLSFVPGKYENSGFKTGSNGNRIYFYYHDRSAINKTLVKYGFQIINQQDISYTKGNNIQETHTVLICKKS